MPVIEAQGLRKEYDEVVAVEDISFTVEEGDLLTLLGPSGCGKTTTLDLVSGLTTPDRGDIIINGEQVNNTTPENRNTAKVFQEYALFPHLTVGENVGFGLAMDGISKQERKHRIQEMLEMVDLGGLMDRQISELSGGQRQRVATARALVKQPAVLLLDEPFSALDLQLREQLQIELKELQEELDITAIHVTHDQEEAMVLSDKVVVMNDGRKLQQGTPSDIYENPKNRFVADFIGKSNLITGTVVDNGNDKCVVEPMHSDNRFVGIPTMDDSLKTGDDVTLCIRPEKCNLQKVASTNGAPNQLPGQINHKFMLGSTIQYRLAVQDEVFGDPDQEFLVEDKNVGINEINQKEDLVITCDPQYVKIIRGGVP